MLASLAALIGIGATAPSSRPQPFVTSMARLTAGHPELEAMWRDARASQVAIETTKLGKRYRIVSDVPPLPKNDKASTKGRWVTTAKPLAFGALENRPGSFELLSGDHPTIRVHRIHSEAAKAVVDGGALVVTEASPGMDAVVFARAASSIEELLVVRDPSVEIGYDLELPRGWSLHQGPPRELIEVRDERDVAQLRMRARAGWDAHGHEIEITPRANGSRISIAFPREAPAPLLIDPIWEDTGAMLDFRTGHTATLLPNGRILIAGGGGMPDAEIFDPVTRAFTTGPPMTVTRLGQSATMLRSGRVLLVGGGEGWPAPQMDSVSWTAEVFDSNTNMFTPTSSPMSFPHLDGHTATRLADGRVLVTGATSGVVGGGPGYEAELYDEATVAFQTTVPMQFGWTVGRAARLPDGKVMVVGNDKAPVSAINLYDALAESVTVAGSTPYSIGPASLTVLEDGRVLLALGADSELLNASTGLLAFTVGVGSPPDHAATLLPSGSILLTGDDSAQEIALSAGVVLSQTDTQMSTARAKHTSTLLPDGRVFVVGGSNTVKTGELFEPRAGRPLTGGQLNLQNGPAPSPWGHYRQPVALAQGASFIPLQAWPEGRGLVLDPTTGQTQVVGGPQSGFGGITSVLLDDGRVLVIGTDDSGRVVTVGFDPSDQTFGAPHVLPPPRVAGHDSTFAPTQATLLPNGNVLVLTYGESGFVYDPVAQAYTTTAPLPVNAVAPEATLLADGRVLVTGGLILGTGLLVADAQIYDPSSNSFSLTGAMHIPRINHRATLLASGKVLISGGFNPITQQGFDSAEVYDPATQTFDLLTSPMTVARSHHAALLLPSGQVALGGGGSATVEVFDPYPAPGSFRAAGALGWSAPNAEAAFLTDGNILFVGPDSDSQQPGRWATWDWNDAIADSSRPLLGAVPSSVAQGSTTDLAGDRFEGIGEGSGGVTNASPTDYPIALWMPIGRGYPSIGTIGSWTPTSAKWTVPRTSFPGPGMFFVVANGVSSVGRLLTIPPSPLGASCTSNVQCSSGVCADGTCCDQPCDGLCKACSAAAKGAGPDGICGIVQAGLPSPACPTEDVKLCGHDGLCDANGQCALYPDRTKCAPGETCKNGVCVLGFRCDGEHVLSMENAQPIDCAPYRCSAVTDQCFSACESNLECVDGDVCGASGHCEARLTNGPASSCALEPGDASAASGLGFGVALFGLAIGRRRLARGRSSGHGAEAN